MAQPIENSAQRIVLLTNGNIILGDVEPHGDRVVVWASSGSRLVLLSNQVDAVFQSIETAFQYLRERSDIHSVREQIKLFDWCLRYKMWDQAQSQIDRLQFMPIPKVDLLRLNESLAIARQQSEPSGIAIVPLPGSPNPASQAVPTESINVDSQPNSQIQTVSFEEAPRLGQKIIPAGELNALLERLPESSVRQYERRIDAILVRSCGNAGCHDARDSRFALLQIDVVRETPRSMKLQNLVRCLQHVGPDAVGTSPLLRAAAKPHGGHAQAALPEQSLDYRELALWVRELGSSPVDAGFHAIDLTAKSAAVTHIAIPQVRETGAELLPASQKAISNSTDSGAPHSVTAPPPSVPKLELDTNTFVPRDPFDPEIFNRFYLNRPPTSGGGLSDSGKSN